ncbi:MAG: hypothetical protein WA688_05470 [Thermoplasmata archaeon]
MPEAPRWNNIQSEELPRALGKAVEGKKGTDPCSLDRLDGLRAFPVRGNLLLVLLVGYRGSLSLSKAWTG